MGHQLMGLALSPLKLAGLRIYVAVVCVFLLAPILTITISAFTKGAYVSFPPKGLTLHWYAGIIHQTDFMTSLKLSLIVAAVAATIGTAVGLLAALAAVRQPTRLNRLVWMVVLSPIMLPSIVLGMAFLTFYGRLGYGNSEWALVVSHVVLVTPFAAALIFIGVETLDPVYERAARSLGAGPGTALFRVTLPLIAWSLVAGWALAFMISFGDAAVSLFMATPTLTTLPVRIYSSLEWSPLDPSLTAIASGLVIITFVVLAGTSLVVRPNRILSRNKP
jgi:putative spermidine/putrescine transport system permease protein